MVGAISIILRFIGIWIWPDRPAPAWPLYAACSACFVLACFAVWAKEHKEKHAAVADLEALKAKMRTFPRLIAANEDVSTQICGFQSETAYVSPSWQYLSVRFVNDPIGPTPESIALHVVCEVKFFDSDTSAFLYETSGRWMDSIPPRPGSVGPESVDFSIGQSRTLCVALKPIADSVCHAVSNGTWTDREFHRIAATEIVARIRLRCPYFHQTWSLRFSNLGEKRGLKFLEFRAES